MEKYDIIFESNRLYFIKMTDSLIDEYLKMYNDPEIQKTLFRDTFTSEEILRWLKNQLLNKEACIFSIMEKNTNKYIGNVEIIIKDNIGEIVISITPEEQDKHFGTEAIKSIIEYGYNTIGLEELVLNVYKTNERAIHCYQNMGFSIDGEGITEEEIIMWHHRK